MTNNADAGFRPEKHIPIGLTQPLVLEVHNPNGDVTVRAVDRTDVLIGHGAPGRPSDLGDVDFELLIDAHDNRIEVRPNPRAGAGWANVNGDIDLDAVVGQITKAFGRGGSWSSAKPGKVRVASGGHAWCDISIEVPQAITGRVEVHTASGDVRIEDVASEIALKTMSGDARVVRTSGDLVLQTASGDLVIESATGRITAHSASGDLRITSARIDDFHIQTASGDILLDAVLAGDGPFRIQSASGDVRLTLRRSTAGGEEPAATLAFHTISGDAHVTPPFRKTERRLWRAGSGDGGPRVDVTTVSGDLTAGFAAADSAFVPATRPEAGQSAAQGDAVRLAVLEAVERGEIDIDEALQRLEAADSVTSP